MTILDQILEVKREELATRSAERPLGELEPLARAAPAVRGLEAALRRDADQPVRVIAEVKRASPSAGPIRPGADPGAIAREYAQAGAAAVSVLTDESFFDGRLEFLPRAREAGGLPVLRKDFIIDPYQVVEARAWSADAVLLIVAALDDARLRELLAEVRRWGMDALVEVHDEAEAERALWAGATLVGVNHRDLKTFSIDMTLSRRIAPLLPARAVLVGESGIQSAADIQTLAAAGAHAVLVGERLMRAASPGAALAELLREVG